MNDGHPADGNEGLLSSIFRKFSAKGKKEDDVTEEEIIDMVNEGQEQGVLEEDEAEMINNIFELGEKQAQDVMTHRKSIVAIDCQTTVEEAFDFVVNGTYSRYPVYDGDIDKIVGVMHLRDLLKIYVDEHNRGKKLIELKNHLMFDVSYVPETRNVNVLFKAMQSKKVHMAVVVDEYGQTAGIVTLEDILEEIVGNILDEYDDEDETISRQPDGTYVMAGTTFLEDIEDMFEIKFVCDDIDTINGYLINEMGRIPHEGDEFQCECDGYLFTVLEVTGRMITKVEAKKIVNQSV